VLVDRCHSAVGEEGVLGKSLEPASLDGPTAPLQAPTAAAVDFPASGERLLVPRLAIAAQPSAIRW